MVSIFFLGGVILTILGIMGVYLGRIFQEVKNRPLFVISNKINFK
jgi:dolichol-phosphate mannosyltransferase